MYDGGSDDIAHLGTANIGGADDSIPRLASPITEIRDHYEVVVIGSGYGGAIAASRLARAGRLVCLLERGREIRPGEYPRNAKEGLAETQVHTCTGLKGSETGLYDFRVQPDISVFQGCGLGGTSLVNAGVSIRPEDRIFEDPRWPAALREDSKHGLEEGYRRALTMLGATPTPDQVQPLKTRALARSAAAMNDAPFRRTHVNVTFETSPGGRNFAGVPQRPCTMCGDCVSGCNESAKNTLLMNYLPDAHRFGAKIFTEVEVRHIERSRDGKHWNVHFRLLGSGQDEFEAPEMFVQADVVVLGAGALGSTEILLRSKALGLSLSDKVGYRFSGNGDVLGFGYNCDERINAVGFGERTRVDMDPPDVGPCITSVIDLRDQPVLDDGMIIQEGSVPAPIASAVARAAIGAAVVGGQDTDSGILDEIREAGRALANVVGSAHHGAIQNTQVYLVMTHDGSDGQVVLPDPEGRVHVDWPNVGRNPVFERVEERLVAATRALGGVYVGNPLWTEMFGKSLVTVHPLGGCAMADDASEGVVDHEGRVFSGSTGQAVHEGLHVCDGSVIPRSLGANPLLTISAIAERTVQRLADARGWSFAVDTQPATLPASTPEPAVGVKFSERMSGHIDFGDDLDPRTAEKNGRLAGYTCEFVLTVLVDDVVALTRDPNYRAGLVGTVVAPALWPAPLTVTGGHFTLFARESEDADTRHMNYRMRLTADNGSQFYFSGFKVLHDDPGFDAWQDTTTLFVTLHRGEDDSAPVVARGILHIDPADFTTQLATMTATNARGALAGAAAVARFGAHFSRTLANVYGGF